MDMIDNLKVAVIAHYPIGNEIKDGMFLRIKSIDDLLFEGHKRCYIESSCCALFETLYFLARDLKHNRLFAKNDTDERFTLKYTNYFTLKNIFKKIDIIYVQTWFGLKVIPYRLLKEFADKIYFDIHGCFVEEFEYLNKSKFACKEAMKYEKRAFSVLKNFVCVSQNMINHYKKKYPETENCNYIKLPIFSLNSNENNVLKVKRDKIRIIYSGRTSKWQNVPEMINSIKVIQKYSNLEVKIYSPDTEEFAKEFNSNDIEGVTVESVKPDCLKKLYKEADLGLILREKNIVNKVACPTKLIEYVANGIVPVVLQPEIGDFADLGYKYVLNEDLLKNKIPSFEELQEMRRINFYIIKKYDLDILHSQENIINLLTTK